MIREILKFLDNLNKVQKVNKKAIGPVVASALLLVVAVVSVVGFQGWFNEYSSEILADTETQTSGGFNTGIEDVVDGTLYFLNGNSNNITINSVKIDGINCNISNSYGIGINELDISSCIDKYYYFNTRSCYLY